MLERQPNFLHSPLPETTPPQPSRPKRVVLYFFIALIAVALIRAVSAGWRTEPPLTATPTILKPTRSGFLRSVKNFMLGKNPTLLGEIDDRVNILLLGMGGPGHDGPYLTDTNIILSIKPSTKEVALVSVPRDLGINIPGFGWRKINHVNSFGEEKNPGGGGEFAREIFASTFNLSIPYYARVDFKAFQEIIDAVGGVSVNVPRGFTDTQFPGPNYSFRTTSFAAGPQVMNGQRALEYARSRHGGNGEGSDFARSLRQQLILSALKEKLSSPGVYLNPLTLENIFESVSAHLSTNLTFDQLLYLASLAREINTPPKLLVLDNSPGGFLISTTGESGAFLLLPKSGSFDNIREAITGIFTASSTCQGTDRCTVYPSLSALNGPQPIAGERPPITGTIEIQNGTWRAGLASRLKDRLAQDGYNIIAVGNTLIRPVSSTAIYVLSSTSSSTVRSLERSLRAKVAPLLPVWLTPGYDNPESSEDERGMKYNNETDVLIVIGNDYKE